MNERSVYIYIYTRVIDQIAALLAEIYADAELAHFLLYTQRRVKHARDKNDLAVL